MNNTKIETPWDLNDLQYSIFDEKYRYNNESFDGFIDRVSNGNKYIAKLIREKKFLFAGRILANRGLYKDGKKVTYSNCYVLPQPEDSIEGIYEAAYNAARTFSYGGGVGLDISKLRPNGSKVNNAAKTTTGAVSFMDLFNMTTSIIGQKGRRGAMIISMDINHPDILDFINIKSNDNSITKANISLRINDKFMKAVLSREIFRCEFIIKDTNEVIIRDLNAHDVFVQLCKNNRDWADPGILYWDNVIGYNIMDADSSFTLGGVNPCAELPLPEGGSCLLGSINLAEFVENPFTEKAKFSFAEFSLAVSQCVIALNEVLDEGLELHPLQCQRDSVSDYRQIGLGTMGMADMLIKLGLTYGSNESIEFCTKVARIMSNSSLQTSALLARDKGSFTKCNKDLILKSRYINYVSSQETLELINKYGLRNSSILTCAPTGSISTMLGVSGGIEPIFSLSYTRKTESLGDGDQYHTVFTGIAKDYMELNNITDESLLPEYFITSQKIHYEDRIKMQSVWQKYIDAAISSTVNLPYETTVEEVYDIYVKAWEYGLKGLTIYRDGCARSGILITDKTKTDKKENEDLEQTEVEVAEETQGCST
ncbi:MAG: adenosylcobalamin-dependent ribonucleoside-diphosphate reductase [Paraclostridium sp.]